MTSTLAGGMRSIDAMQSDRKKRLSVPRRPGTTANGFSTTDIVRLYVSARTSVYINETEVGRPQAVAGRGQAEPLNQEALVTRATGDIDASRSAASVWLRR